MFVLLILIPQFFLRAHPYDMALSLKGGTSTLYLQFPVVYHHFPVSISACLRGMLHFQTSDVSWANLLIKKLGYYHHEEGIPRIFVIYCVTSSQKYSFQYVSTLTQTSKIPGNHHIPTYIYVYIPMCT